jgi:hypothetical protein
MTGLTDRRYDSFAVLSRLAGLDLPFQMRFGGDGSRSRAMRLRFGPVELGDVLHGHLLVDDSRYRLAVKDAVVWDHAVRGFVLCEVDELDRLTDRLDLTAAIWNGVGETFEGLAHGVVGALSALLTPGFFIIGGIGLIVICVGAYYLLLYLLAHWLLWWVILPSFAIACVSFGIRDARRSRLRGAVLAAANSAVPIVLEHEWALA